MSAMIENRLVLLTNSHLCFKVTFYAIYMFSIKPWQHYWYLSFKNVVTLLNFCFTTLHLSDLAEIEEFPGEVKYGYVINKYKRKD